MTSRRSIAGDPHGARRRVVHAGDQLRDGRLARARVADERDQVPRRDGEADVVEGVLGSGDRQRRDGLQGRQRDLVGPRVPEADAVELDGRPVLLLRRAQVGRVRLLRDRRLQVQHLEHALEADQRRHHVDLDVRHRGQRAVQAAEVGGERDDDPDGELPPDRHDAAEAVDDRDRDGRESGEADAEPGGVQGAGDADVADAADLVRVVLRLALRVAEDLDQVRAGHVEPLVHDLRGVGVQGVALAGDGGDLLAEPACREDERGEQDQAQQGQLPGHAEHRREHEHDGQRVAHHVLQGAT